MNLVLLPGGSTPLNRASRLGLPRVADEGPGPGFGGLCVVYVCIHQNITCTQMCECVCVCACLSVSVCVCVYTHMYTCHDVMCICSHSSPTSGVLPVTLVRVRVRECPETSQALSGGDETE